MTPFGSNSNHVAAEEAVTVKLKLNLSEEFRVETIGNAVAMKRSTGNNARAGFMTPLTDQFGPTEKVGPANQVGKSKSRFDWQTQ